MGTVNNNNNNVSDINRDDLSLDLLVCFYIQYWEPSDNINSVDDWLNIKWEEYRIETNMDIVSMDKVKKSMMRDFKHFSDLTSKVLYKYS